MAKNSNLSDAKRNKNDEFYTQYSDIEAEMNAYYEYNNDVFRDKTILLPCDDPEWSNFTKYFANNFKRFGIKKLISTSYAKSAGNQQISDFERQSPFFDESKHAEHGKLFILTHDTDGDGIIDNDDVRFEGYLEGDGDFRSEEVTKLRDEADIIITNPPFSLFREFLAWIMEGKKQFAIIGNQNAITYKEVFPLIRNGDVWLGYRFNQRVNGKNMTFRVPDNYPMKGTELYEEDGIKYISVAGTGWFTNMDHGKRHEWLQLMTMEQNLKFNKKLRKKLEDSYGKLEYPHYDNYDAIEVPLTEAIPSDYDGVMGVPISFLPKYNPEQFEIVAFRKGEDGKDLVFTREREREFNRTFASLYDVDSRDDKKRRRQDKWEDYLRKNNYQTEIEPIDLFYPVTARGCVEPCINLDTIRRMGWPEMKSRQIKHNGILCQKTYHRLLIRRRKEE